MVVTQLHSIWLLCLVLGGRQTRRPGRTGRSFRMSAVPRHKTNGPIIDIGGLAIQREGVMPGVEITVAMDISIHDHGGARVNLEVIIIKDCITPERNRFLLENT